MSDLLTIFTALLLISRALTKETSATENLLEPSEKAELSECYGDGVSLQQIKELGWTVELPAVDISDRRCYNPISFDELKGLYSFSKDAVDEAFASLSYKVCPFWTQSKECLDRHLFSRCNSSERQILQTSFGFIDRLVCSELLCGPEPKFLQVVQEAASEGGLWQCLNGQYGIRDGQCHSCMQSEDCGIETNVLYYTEETQKVFEGDVQLLKVCANCSMERELALRAPWKRFNDLRWATLSLLRSTLASSSVAYTSVTALLLQCALVLHTIIF